MIHPNPQPPTHMEKKEKNKKGMKEKRRERRKWGMGKEREVWHYIFIGICRTQTPQMIPCFIACLINLDQISLSDLYVYLTKPTFENTLIKKNTLL